MALVFEWDPAKDKVNRLLAVMFTERGDDRVRIFSARRATPQERSTYEEDYR